MISADGVVMVGLYAPVGAGKVFTDVHRASFGKENVGISSFFLIPDIIKLPPQKEARQAFQNPHGGFAVDATHVKPERAS